MNTSSCPADWSDSYNFDCAMYAGAALVHPKRTARRRLVLVRQPDRQERRRQRVQLGRVSRFWFTYRRGCLSRMRCSVHAADGSETRAAAT